MRISVLVPSEEYRSYAGARIRYGRLRPELAQLGVHLDLEDVADFAPDRARCDALLISKCHDARSLIAATALSDRGCLVGVDLFDDYFSQRADIRLARFRNWLRQLLPVCDFALSSTPLMGKVAGRFQSDLPVHVVNDPAASLEFADLPAILGEKLARMRDERKLRLVWFGVGDNPFFKVGLSDLAAFGGMLGTLRQNGMDVELTVLTNARSLDADGLALIGKLPVRTMIHEWSEERERKTLAGAFACFLPVNSGAFSAAKSLNRAVTALSAGCQVISAGYPLYEPLGSLIYRDVNAFLIDIAEGETRLSADTIDDFQSTLVALASPANEAHALVRFLKGLDSSPSINGAASLALVHGQSTTEGAHRTVHSVKGLSVGSPFCTVDLGFDVIFRREPGRISMLVSEGAISRLKPEVRGRLQDGIRISDRKFWHLPNEPAVRLQEARAELPLSLQLATYASTMEHVRCRLADAFGPCRIIISENAPIPFSTPGKALESC